MKIYQWDEKTKFYIGDYDYIQHPTGKMSLVNATINAPNIVLGKLCKWNGTKWINVDDVWGKVCWNGEMFIKYRYGEDFPIESRNITPKEIDRLNRHDIWVWENKNGNPEWTAKEATESDKESKKNNMNILCQNWILNKLGITMLDEVLYPEKRKLADNLAKSLDDKWDKYIKQIEKAKTMEDLDFIIDWE